MKLDKDENSPRANPNGMPDTSGPAQWTDAGLVAAKMKSEMGRITAPTIMSGSRAVEGSTMSIDGLS